MVAEKIVEILRQENGYIAVNRPANGEISFTSAKPIYPLDSELSGIALFGENNAITAALRNALGSDQMAFQFMLIAKTAATLPDEITCDLPLAPHFQENRMVVSHRTGKKTFTKFKKIEASTSHTLWSAETTFIRRHQIRLHAHEVGISIFGENIYAQIAVPSLPDFKKNVKQSRKGPPSTFYNSICIHLAKLHFSLGGSGVTIEAPWPEKLGAMLKIMAKWS
jgi:23S rRNA-/tRNA-specific pseudouridylate synthase